MLLGFGILAVGFVAALWGVLVRHAGWNRAIASLVAAAICPLLLVVYAYTREDSLEGGLALMFGIPIAISVGLVGVGLAALGEALLRIGAADPDRGED